MHALLLKAPQELSYEEVPVPTPGPGDLLIKVKATTTCGTDLKAFRRGHPMIPMPGPLGHEYSGVVVAAGEGAKFKVGDPVMGVHSAPCQACYWCQQGQENLCETIMATMVLGSYAEYLLIPKRIADLNVFDKPDSISFEMASLLEPLACVAQGVSKLPLTLDSSVLVIGPGAIGLMFVAALKAVGVEDVTLAGRNAGRLAVGESLGAKTCFITEIPFGNPNRYDIVVECTGQVEVWEWSVNYSRRGGTVMLFGGCPSGTRASFDTAHLHYDQVTLLSPFHFGTDAVKMSRDWLLNSNMDLSPIISGERKLKEGRAVLEDLEASRGLKYVFKP